MWTMTATWSANQPPMTRKMEQSPFQLTISQTTSFTPQDELPTFEDVGTEDWFYDAVNWAVGAGVTTGKNKTTFAPYDINTRGEAVTFLWRTSGSPSMGETTPFDDIDQDGYYYEAVLWAVEKGITKGTSQSTFSPDDTCTRGQIVTFLWRMAGKPETDATNPFEDVASDAYYYTPVLWAATEGITQGKTETTFSPDEHCNRAEIVTFLYRHLGF